MSVSPGTEGNNNNCYAIMIDEVQRHDPLVDETKLKAKAKSIVENARQNSKLMDVTVKGVRKMLEEWLDMDLSNHKGAIRSIIMEAI